MQGTRWRRCFPLFLLVLACIPTPLFAPVVFRSETSHTEYDVRIPSLRIEPDGWATVQIAIDRSFGVSQPDEVLGCRFRVAHVPAGWTVHFIQSPNAVSVSLGDHTFDVQFFECQSISNGNPIVLGDLVLRAASDVEVRNHLLYLVSTDRRFPLGPVVRLCDSAKMDVPSGPLVINPPVAVNNTTWSAIKRLYGS